MRKNIFTVLLIYFLKKKSFILARFGCTQSTLELLSEIIKYIYENFFSQLDIRRFGSSRPRTNLTDI